MKYCSRCETESDNFGINRSARDGLQSYCRPCRNEMKRENTPSEVTYTRIRYGKIETVTRRRGAHGRSRTPLYRVWKGMRERCYNPNAQNYRFYGGRGVTICGEWRHDFMAFHKWAMSNGYEPGVVELDRISSSRGYSPKNCRWVTKAENLRRMRQAFQPEVDKALSVYAARNGVDRFQVIQDALVAYLAL